jgi:hypothetical protein
LVVKHLVSPVALRGPGLAWLAPFLGLEQCNLAGVALPVVIRAAAPPEACLGARDGPAADGLPVFAAVVGPVLADLIVARAVPGRERVIAVDVVGKAEVVLVSDVVELVDEVLYLLAEAVVVVVFIEHRGGVGPEVREVRLEGVLCRREVVFGWDGVPVRERDVLGSDSDEVKHRDVAMVIRELGLDFLVRLFVD